MVTITTTAWTWTERSVSADPEHPEYYATNQETPEGEWYYIVRWSESAQGWQWSKAWHDKRWNIFFPVMTSEAQPKPRWSHVFPEWADAAIQCERAAISPLSRYRGNVPAEGG